MKEWEAAYLAGIIDGEGSITLTKNHKNEFRRPCISGLTPEFWTISLLI
ncbi:hypothetical protein [Robertmurraya andreesenii]|uniref:Homing endonuclease LAGLIDADG domain-containing protein n=1 Tax=Anoxybacillus andreesenii TaxID=1325932 RepID=A0ABT9V9F8_9BACL|nr:hypothetical protein [Robertmurraya andreesenii]MDQ0157596.1 hypothetical protein [Robertmurraya andreesenii]